MRKIKHGMTRPVEDADNLSKSVKGIIGRVVNEGDKVLKEFNERFDECKRDNLRVSPEEIEEAYAAVTEEQIKKIKDAATNIMTFAIEQKKCIVPLDSFEVAQGISIGHRVIPVESVCCYVPGGNYPLFSTAIMLGIPAKVAEVDRVIACTPAMKGSDKVNPLTLVALNIAGIEEIYVVGGAQAIAAAAYGTEEIEPVDMIVGPGNQYVTEAKRQCYGKVGIDFTAGPSEVMILADETGNAKLIAADILAQSEHDSTAKGILVTSDEDLANDVIGEVEAQLEKLETKETAFQSWEDYGEVVLVDSYEEMVDYANAYGPEHLEVCVGEERLRTVADNLRNYGSLFIGQYSAEVFGDYASGTNHTLPTAGAAKYTGGVWVGTFLKVCTHQKIEAKGVQEIAPLTAELADEEGLDAHSKAASIRLKLADKETEETEE